MKKSVLVFIIVFILAFVLTFLFLNAGSLLKWINYFMNSGKETHAALPVSSNNLKVVDTGAQNTASKIATLNIPSLNMFAPIVFSQSKKEEDLQKDLEKGVALYPGSVLPGESGTSVIIGHSSSYPWYKGKYGSIFSLLEKLKTGDKIIINYKEKNITYFVKNQIKATSQSVQLLQMQNSDLVLMSCWPVGTNSIRIAVSADLEK